MYDGQTRVISSLTRSGQRFLHKLLFGKAHPPLARFAIFARKHFFAHTIARLLANLLQILSEQIC